MVTMVLKYVALAQAERLADKAERNELAMHLSYPQDPSGKIELIKDLWWEPALVEHTLCTLSLS